MTDLEKTQIQIDYIPSLDCVAILWAKQRELNYVPEFTRALVNQPYDRTSNERVNMDISFTKRFNDGWATSLNARNIFSTDYKERLSNQSDGSLYESRVNQAIPSVLISLEKKF